MLRELKIDDSKGMLEWMKDPLITKGFNKNFSNYTINDCKDFILKNELNYYIKEPNEIHFAVIDETNEYKGTVSLKHINYQYGFAEFAIIITKSAQGTGLAKTAFNEIVKYGFEELQLKYIYFSCKKDNLAANKFYTKVGAKAIDFDELIEKNHRIIDGYDLGNVGGLCWYII